MTTTATIEHLDPEGLGHNPAFTDVGGLGADVAVEQAT